jgi:hypothetical protein
MGYTTDDELAERHNLRPVEEIPGIQLVEAGQAPVQDETTPPIRVSVDSIMDQIHQHWARLMAAQIQHNAELSAAVAALSDENAELKAKHAAMMGANGL